MSNLPPGCRESDIPGCSPADARYERWFYENESQLLEWFFERFTDAPQVKDWDDFWRGEWDDFVAHQWEIEEAI